MIKAGLSPVIRCVCVCVCVCVITLTTNSQLQIANLADLMHDAQSRTYLIRPQAAHCYGKTFGELCTLPFCIGLLGCESV